MQPDLVVTSLQNPRIKHALRLRKRPVREAERLLLIEGYRELKRAVDNRVRPTTVFYCSGLFQGGNEWALVAACRGTGAELVECTEPVFRKMAYRDRPEGLLAVAPRVGIPLTELTLPACPLVVAAVAIEKPGNLGSILRSADAAGADAVLVCDERTDLNNPNTVRASIGTLFCLPVVEADGAMARAWLRARGIRILAATPHAERTHTEVDLTGPVAIAVGTEQVGLSADWLAEASLRVRIPMLGQADSLNVANATTVLLYEAMRQRHA